MWLARECISHITSHHVLSHSAASECFKFPWWTDSVNVPNKDGDVDNKHAPPAEDVLDATGQLMEDVAELLAEAAAQPNQPLTRGGRKRGQAAPTAATEEGCEEENEDAGGEEAEEEVEEEDEERRQRRQEDEDDLSRCPECNEVALQLDGYCRTCKRNMRKRPRTKPAETSKPSQPTAPTQKPTKPTQKPHTPDPRNPNNLPYILPTERSGIQVVCPHCTHNNFPINCYCVNPECSAPLKPIGSD